MVGVLQEMQLMVKLWTEFVDSIFFLKKKNKKKLDFWFIKVCLQEYSTKPATNLK